MIYTNEPTRHRGLASHLQQLLSLEARLHASPSSYERRFHAQLYRLLRHAASSCPCGAHRQGVAGVLGTHICWDGCWEVVQKVTQWLALQIIVCLRCQSCQVAQGSQQAFAECTARLMPHAGARLLALATLHPCFEMLSQAGDTRPDVPDQRLCLHGSPLIAVCTRHHVDDKDFRFRGHYLTALPCCVSSESCRATCSAGQAQNMVEKPRMTCLPWAGDVTA